MVADYEARRLRRRKLWRIVRRYVLRERRACAAQAEHDPRPGPVIAAGIRARKGVPW